MIFNWAQPWYKIESLLVYTRKLSGTQPNYTVGEKELLGIVKGLKAFAGVICCQDLTVHTDSSNLLYNKLLSQKMMRWRLLLKEYNPKVVHSAGTDNDAADTLSRLDPTDKADDLIIWGVKTKRLEYVGVHMMNMCVCLCLNQTSWKTDLIAMY